MIKLPKFTTQSMYDSETDFNLQMNTERISKLLIHYEIFKKIIKVKVILLNAEYLKALHS